MDTDRDYRKRMFLTVIGILISILLLLAILFLILIFFFNPFSDQ